MKILTLLALFGAAVVVAMDLETGRFQLVVGTNLIFYLIPPLRRVSPVPTRLSKGFAIQRDEILFFVGLRLPSCLLSLSSSGLTSLSVRRA